MGHREMAASLQKRTQSDMSQDLPLPSSTLQIGSGAVIWIPFECAIHIGQESDVVKDACPIGHHVVDLDAHGIPFGTEQTHLDLRISAGIKRRSHEPMKVFSQVCGFDH